MKLRSLTIGLSLLATGTVIGVATQQFASADISSGDRPVLVPIETCRIADTRPAPNNVGPKASPLATADTMTVSAQQTGTDCTGKIPAGASALSLNVTALGATSNSFLTIWPGGPRPTASALNPAPGQRVFNAVTTEISADQTFDIFNNRGNVNVFVDVNGYYVNHDHDDRYYTQAQVDAALTDVRAELMAPKIETLVIGPAAFRSIDTGDDSILEGGFVYLSPTASDDIVLVAPAPLPDGATLRSLSARIADPATPENVTVTLVCAQPNGGRSTIDSVSSSGAPGWATFETPLAGTVDEAACVYQVEVDLVDPGFALHRVTIEYETAGG